MSEQVHALYLGSAGPLALVRCGLCGRRNCFDRRGWQWFEVAFCRRCRQGVLFEGLVMITRWEGERLLMENEAFGGELRALREVERVVRGVVRSYESEPHWFWPLRVRRMAADLRGPFALAEVARARPQGNPAAAAEPAPPEARDEFTAAPPEEGDGDDVYQLTGEESRALDLFGALTPELRGRVLSDLEELSRHCAGGGTAAEVPTPALPTAAITAGGEGGGRA